MELALPQSPTAVMLLMAAGYFLRSIGMLSHKDGQTGLRIATYVTFPAFMLQAMTAEGFLLGSALVGGAAALLNTLVTAAAAWFVFRKRHPRERAQLSGITSGAEVATFAAAWCACIWGAAGAEAVAAFACVNALAEGVVSYLLFGSGGPGRPKAYEHADGGVYDGEWSGLQKDGLGVYRYPNGARYEGWWHNDQKHGRGTYVFANGGKFEGEFVKGERNGLGVRSWPTGSVKAAYFREGKLLRHVDLWECGSVLHACKQAAAAARAVRTGGGTFAAALRQPALYPPLLATAATVAVHQAALDMSVLQPWLGVTASVHIPLALLAFGACIRPVRVERRHVQPLCTVLMLRLVPALCVACMLLAITPQSLPYAMRAAAVITCLLAPMSLRALDYAALFRLNEAVTAGAVLVSVAISIVTTGCFASAAWLADVVPSFEAFGRQAARTGPLANATSYILLAVVASLWLAPRVWRDKPAVPDRQVVKMTLRTGAKQSKEGGGPKRVDSDENDGPGQGRGVAAAAVVTRQRRGHVNRVLPVRLRGPRTKVRIM